MRRTTATLGTKEAENSGPEFGFRTKLALVLLTLFGTALSIALSSAKPFWEDELFEFYSDSRPSAIAIIEAQKNTPFSLEPPAFHLLLHTFQKLPVRAEVSTRLPSILALAILQICSFVLTRKLTGRSQAALLAMAIPLCTSALEYASEARVYEVLSATFACGLVSYTYAITLDGARRTLAQIVLAVALATTILLHFFGLLIVLPFFAAEIFRTAMTRHLDRRMLLALIVATSAFLLNLPQLPTLRAIQATYYDSGESRWRLLPHTYFWLLGTRKIAPLDLAFRGAYLIVPLILMTLLAFALARFWRSSVSQRGVSYRASFVLLAASLLLPAIELTVGHLHSHAFSPRYALPTIAALSVVLALLGERLFAPRTLYTGGWIALLLLISATDQWRLIRLGLRQRAEIKTTLVLTPTLNATVAAADGHLYIQDLATFLVNYYYAPVELKHLLVNVQSVDRELALFHVAVASKFAMNMRASTQLPVVTYESLLRTPGKHLLVLYKTQSEWLPEELKTSTACIAVHGSALGGRLLELTEPCFR